MGRAVDERRMFAAQIRAAVDEHRFDPRELRTQLVEQHRHRALEPVEVQLAPHHLGAVLGETLRQRARIESERHADDRREQRAVEIERQCIRGAGIGAAIQARLWKAPLQLAQDALRVAIDIRADLHHRRLAIAAGQRHEIRFRHDHGDRHGAPRQPLDAQCLAHLLGIRRHGIVMQDDVGHGAPDCAVQKNRRCRYIVAEMAGRTG